MPHHLKVGASLTTGLLALVVVAVGLPVLASIGLIAADSPTNGAGELRTDGIPAEAAIAYQRAAAAAADFSPPCRIPSWLLAGVGAIESGHGTTGDARTEPDGKVVPPIIGPALPKLGPDTDDGIWDGSTSVDHAVGPMQFIPATWRDYALDGNDDGTADPHSIYDAAMTGAAYLCASGSPMATEDDWRRALLAYNHSSSYVADVLAAAYRYRLPPSDQGNDGLSAAIQLVEVPGIGPTNSSWAQQVQELLASATADGVHLTGGSYRDPMDQVALRKRNCGSSYYATYEMPASQCSPPTARPGTSMHELGLAIDFNNCSSRRTECFRWLDENADRFGVSNLPSEPWHWSVNGR